MAIAHWFAARDTERRISPDPLSADGDRMRQIMAFINSGFTGAFSPLWVALEMDPPRPAMQASMREFGKEAVIGRHDKLEAMVGDTPYLVGDRPTLADALFIGVARWLEFHEVAEPARWPKLAALRARLEADPAVIFATALESGDSVAGSGAFRGHVPLTEVIDRFGA